MAVFIPGNRRGYQGEQIYQREKKLVEEGCEVLSSPDPRIKKLQKKIKTEKLMKNIGEIIAVL